MSDHIVHSYDQELKALSSKIAQMGGLAEKMVASSVEALTRRDPHLAQQVIDTDPQMDALEKEVEAQTISMLVRRQPMAVDLRHIMAAMRIAHDLERVGDLAKNIAKRVKATMSEAQLPRFLLGLEHMSELSLSQLKEVLDAYLQQNGEAALAVWQKDGEVDALHTSLFRELLTYMMEDPRNITLCIHLLFCAKNIERIGDHATNIAETVHYVVTGTAISAERPKGASIYSPHSPEKGA